MDAEKRPEPVRNEVVVWTTLGALVSALLTQYAPDMGEALISAITEAVIVILPTLVGAGIGVWRARAKVTPLEAPQDETGRRLIADPNE